MVVVIILSLITHVPAKELVLSDRVVMEKLPSGEKTAVVWRLLLVQGPTFCLLSSLASCR